MPIPRRAKNPHRPSRLRRRGTWAAALLALASGGVLTTLMVRSALEEADGPRGRDGDPGTDILTGGTDGPARPGGPPDLAGAMENARLDLLDREDRTRKIGELFLVRTEPVAERRYHIDEPSALLFLDDGRTVHVRADSGEMYIPETTGQPESGRVEGNVVVRLFPAREDGRAIDPDVDEPSGVLRTQVLIFDRTLGELRAPGPVTVTSPLLDGRVGGLLATLNERWQRLERLETSGPGRVAYRFPERDRSPAAAPQPARPPAPGHPGGASLAPARPAAPKPEPVELLYSITLRDEVVMAQEGRQVSSDAFEGWVRLVDGALPEGAIAEVRIAESGPAEMARGEEASATQPARAAGERPESPAPSREGAANSAGAVAGLPASHKSEEVTIAWNGPGVVALLPTAPGTLERDHAAMKFTAHGEGRVLLSDAEAGVSGAMPRLEYFATTRRVRMTGDLPEAVEVKLAETGIIYAGRIDGDLGTGIVDVIGPVRIDPVDGAARRFRIAAQERSAFVLALVDGALSGQLRRAMFSGSVTMEGDEGDASADTARAEFIDTPGGPSTLSRLLLEGSAEMTTGGEGPIAGDRIDIAMRTSSDGTSRPDRITITGGAQARRGSQQIESELLEAQIVDAGGGLLALGSALARGSVVYTDEEQGLRAIADELWFEGSGSDGAPRESVDLTGQVELERRRDGDLSRIVGDRARLDGTGKVLDVIGAGRFEHFEDGVLRLAARWSRSMRFDDSLGMVRCEGDAEAISTPSALVKETAKGERIEVELSRDAADDGEARRGIARARVFGDVSRRASFESRRYVSDEAGPEGRRLEQLAFLEGAEIDASEIDGILRVPSAGRLLLVDHRPEAQKAGDEPDDGKIEGPLGRGDSLFEWTTSLAFDRTTGVMEMDGAVQGTHQRLADGEVTGIVCEHLTARTTPAFEGARGGLTGDGRLALLSLRAVGSVHLSSGPARDAGQPMPPLQELTADVVEYDAVRGTVEASATGDNVVTLINPAVVAPTVARALWWDLESGTIRVVRPAPIVTPR